MIVGNNKGLEIRSSLNSESLMLDELIPLSKRSLLFKKYCLRLKEPTLEFFA